MDTAGEPSLIETVRGIGYMMATVTELQDMMKASFLEDAEDIDGRPVVTEQVRVRPGSEGRSILDVTLSEGRNRIVHRWAEAMGLKVDRLARLSYGPVRLGDLPPGRSRPLTPAEESGLYRAIRMKPEEE